MAKTFKLDANFDTRTLDLAALGYTTQDIVTVQIMGGYRNDGHGKDGYHDVDELVGMAHYDINKGKWDISLTGGTDLVIENQDPTLGTNTDPNKDFRIVITAQLFSDHDNIVDFHDLTTIQKQAIKDGDSLYYAYSGSDVVHLPDSDELKNFNSKHMFYGDDGDDIIYGGNRNDRIDGWDDDDTIDGGDGKDYLAGNYGSDTLIGGAGNDQLYGRSEKDILTGGTGADSFIYKKASDSYFGTVTNDIITDFSQAEHDIIDFHTIDANAATKNKNDTFKFIGTDAFSGKAGEVRYYHDGGQTFIEATTDNSGQYTFVVELDGEHDLVKGDFHL